MKTLGVSRCGIIDFNVRGDARGSLVALEERDDVPFDIRRIYYIFDTQPGVVRGLHAHHALQQLVVAVSGSCTMLLDDGENRQAIVLDDPRQGLYLGPMVWHEMSAFSEDCVLMVLADQPYDEGDYIRDLHRFRSLIAG